MLKNTTIVKSENRSFGDTAYTYTTKFDVHVIIDAEYRATVSVAKWAGMDEAKLELKSTLYIQERGNVVIYTNYKTYERPVLGHMPHNYTPEQTVDAFNGPQQIIIYDIEKDDIVYDGFISECPSNLRSRTVKSIDPVDSDGPRAGIIFINI